MITSIRIQNYRSFIDASVKLRPLSLVVGANGAGKTNFVRALASPGAKKGAVPGGFVEANWVCHVNHFLDAAGLFLETHNGNQYHCDVLQMMGNQLDVPSDLRDSLKGIKIYNVQADAVSQPEQIIGIPIVEANGGGVAQVLESLKSGDREDLFDKIESLFKMYVPEVEKLSLRTVDIGTKQIQVRERGLEQPLPATELSEGTRIILCLLTIIHQENPPPIVLLEDIDRGLHPRLFEYLVPVMRDIAERSGINIIATTHNPYLVDCFQDDKEAVIIVEKKDGASTLTTLADKARDLDYDTVDPEDMPLGNLWFSGLVGGVPAKISRRLAKE